MLMTVMVLAAATAPAGDSSANAVIGRWKTQSRGGIVEIARCGPSLCGKLVDSEGLRANPDMADTKNKDAALRGRKLLGMTLLRGFDWDGKAWTGGTVYNAEDGGTYKGTVTPVDANRLKLKGCIVWPLCKTQTWTRVR